MPFPAVALHTRTHLFPYYKDLLLEACMLVWARARAEETEKESPFSLALYIIS